MAGYTAPQLVVHRWARRPQDPASPERLGTWTHRLLGRNLVSQAVGSCLPFLLSAFGVSFRFVAAAAGDGGRGPFRFCRGVWPWRLLAAPVGGCIVLPFGPQGPLARRRPHVCNWSCVCPVSGCLCLCLWL